MTFQNSRQKGKLGERIAAKYLQQQGYTIVEQNFRYRGGELDLIALSHKGCWVFVEVKSSRSASAGLPESWVNAKKIKQIYKVAQYYGSVKGILHQPSRFDVISVNMSGKPYRISHYKNAFLAILDH